MKLAIRLPYHAADVTGAGMAAVASAADGAGFHSGWVADHLVFPAGELRSRTGSTPDGRYPRPMDETTLECWTSLAYCAAVTRRLELGVGVTVLPYRHPLLLAKVIASLDLLSGGRVICGVGVGWLAEEFAALGVPFDDRGRRAEEAIALLRECWRGTPVRFDGEVFPVPDPVHVVPQPLREPPLVFGGSSRPALRRAVRLGDGWIGHEIMPADVPGMRAQLAAAAPNGGVPDGFRFLTSRLMNPSTDPGADPRRLDTDSVGRLADELAAYAAAGTDVLLCEPSVRTVAAHLDLVEQVAAAGALLDLAPA
ncbi:TIGR03619 family F420-dependent LLM class oxidoreductase [Nakamurella sp. YIM 132087]|uniref:TIGR03619 family F420-dependent LLM class oxidoreductase n=1 Tax=Nakamurella alba TaxID=2665158 RepID=A0A7K1FSH4_9ACTN|nr:TIGR03619 family F420-dependent LLM class oxidoreductase [Nakamurella alba]MTD17096.1 TIGR03619 family F420-dependent LLM class oxidoreductase [Nakamurella alba]